MATVGQFLKAKTHVGPYYVNLYHQTNPQYLSKILSEGLLPSTQYYPPGMYFSTSALDTFVGARYRGVILEFKVDISGIRDFDAEPNCGSLVWRLPLRGREAVEIVVFENNRVCLTAVLDDASYDTAKSLFDAKQRLAFEEAKSRCKPMAVSGSAGLAAYLRKHNLNTV